VPRVIITDKLRSYQAAIAEVLPDVEHLQQKYQNNRAENSHQPTRLRERVMRRLKSAATLSLSLRNHHIALPSRETPVQS
jgi:putative transposase